MRLNKYLSIISLGDGSYLLYNALNDFFIGVRSPAVPETFEISDVSLNPVFNQLVEIGGFVDDDFDEAQEVTNRIDSVDCDDNSFILIINPTLACNFRCWYCYEKHDGKPMMSGDVMNSILKYLHKSLLKTDKLPKVFNLSFFGDTAKLPWMNFSDSAKNA